MPNVLFASPMKPQKAFKIDKWFDVSTMTEIN